MSAIKLLFIIDSYKDPYAGTEGQLLKLIEGLDKERFESRLVVFRSSEYISSGKFPVPVDNINVGRLASIASWIKLFRYGRKMRSLGYQIAHVFFNDASMICPPVLKSLGYQIIISRRDMGYWYNFMNVAWLRLNAPLVNRVIVNSQAVKRVTMDREGYAGKKVEVIYNGYLPNDAPGSKQCYPELLNGEEIRIALVANIRPIKRIEDAIRAIQLVQAVLPTARLYVIGAGEQAPLEKLAGDLGVAQKVCFLGARTDVLQLLPLFDVGLLCSESEGFSNTLIEYSQSGLPVVCTNVGGNAEIIEDGVNGFLYEVGDIDALATHLEILGRETTRRVRMGQAGKNKVETVYSLSSAVEKHQKVYLELVRDP